MAVEPTDKPTAEAVPEAANEAEGLAVAEGEDQVMDKAQEDAISVASELGIVRYVHAAFFAAGALIAFLLAKILVTIWNNLADWSQATELVPALLVYGDNQRDTITTLVGVATSLVLVLWAYRKQAVRRWATEVALELSRVTWPSKEMVSNGMVVVLVTSAIFTTYIALLDRFWSFVTTLVYGA
jgi:preprotein translocase subunit SecE